MLGSLISIIIIIQSDNKAEIHVKGTSQEMNEEKDIKKIMFAHKSINSYFYIIMNESVKRATEAKGWEFEYAVADYDQVRQNNQIIHFINQQPDAIITTAIDSIGINDAVQLANQENIPIGVIDTDTSGSDVNIVVSFDNYLAGQTAAQEVVKRLVEKYGTEKGIVFNAFGLEMSNAMIERREGFKSIITQYPEIVYIEKPGNGNADLVKEALLAVFEEYPTIDAVHCSSDQPARGMIEALQELGKWKKVGDLEHVIFVTIDGEPSAIDEINKGYYDASIVQDVVSYGKIVIDLLDQYTFQGELMKSDKYVDNETYWKECEVTEDKGIIKVTIPLYVVDASNSNDTRHWSYVAQEEWGFRYK